MFVWLFYPTSGAHHLCVLRDSHDLKKPMGRPSKKVTTRATNDEQPVTSEE
jgi:hypothetical protein